MSAVCDHCRGPITGTGHAGRPWPGRAAAVYCCFGCVSLGEHQRQEAVAPASERGNRSRIDGLVVRLGVSIFIVAQSMAFGLALNLHDDISSHVRQLVEAAILCGTLLVMGLLGGPLFRAAWHELRRGRLTIEALFLLTMSGAMAASLQAQFTGRGKIYFEVVSVLLVVYTLGKLIGARSRAAALTGARAWGGQLATCRQVGEQGGSRIVPVSRVRAGDRVEVFPGETIAIDGVIREGVGFVSEAPVTGEPFAAVRRPGDRVFAGAASCDATFRIEATAPGTARHVDRLLAAVEEARDRPLSLQSQADRLGRAFFPLLVLTALGTFAYWAFLTPAGWEAGLFNAMSVLLVACPCALGLATPIVVWSALARLTERGLVVRGGDTIERLAAVDRVLFDKTGTLTEDRFTLADVVTAADGHERARLLGWVSLIESRCHHPVARSFAEWPRSFESDVEPRVCGLRVVPGCGVEAVIEDTNGVRHDLRIGRPEWVATATGGTSQSTLVRQLRTTGHRVDVAVDGALAAVAVVTELPREAVPETLAEFDRMRLPVEVLTGDTADRAASLGVPVTHGGLLPEDKRERVEQLKAVGGKPLMVGDGINDASALAAAHVGVALASGTDLAVGAADVTLYHGDLRVLPWAVAVSRHAVRAVRRNLCGALCYNTAGVALAACGVLHPIVAVLLMVASSLTLIVASVRVGVVPDHCESRVGPERTSIRAAIHAAAVVLQGVLFLLLLEGVGPAGVILGGFVLAGAGVGWVWHRWRSVPHTVDMCLGMLTLGNLGMLLGWWADAGFTSLRDAGCCACAAAVQDGLVRRWMCVGMLVFANAAMLGLARRPLPRGNHLWAMLTGGNAGMLLGMFACGHWAARFETGTVAAAVVVGFLGMTLGMLAGMLLGTWLVERLLERFPGGAGNRTSWLGNAGCVSRVPGTGG